MCTSKYSDDIINKIENCTDQNTKRKLLEQINNCIKCSKYNDIPDCGCYCVLTRSVEIFNAIEHCKQRDNKLS